MATKNFSILYSSSASNSPQSISKSKSKSKTFKNKSKGKTKSKSNTKSKSKSKTLKKRRTLGDLSNMGPPLPRPVKVFNKYGKENRSWRKSKQQLPTLKSARDDISSLLSKNNWINKVSMSDIISIRYTPIEEMHIHLYEVAGKIGYHVKVKFPLNNWQLLLQYNVKTNDYDFVIKNNTNTVLMRENWKNKTDVIEKLTAYKAISINKTEADELIENMLNITTIIEKVIKQNVTGGYKNNKRKTNKRKHSNKRKTRKLKNKL